MPSTFNSQFDYWHFVSAVKHHARFVHNSTVLDFLDTLLQTSMTRRKSLREGDTLWRAQLGCSVEMRVFEGYPANEGLPFDVPFPPDRMKPKRLAAHEGRVNPRGIPCLYVSDDRMTAMAEVRPSLGSKLTLGALRVTRDLTLLDFSKNSGSLRDHDFLALDLSPEDVEKAIWGQIDRDYSRPVEADLGLPEYVPTQVIAEFFKVKGLDGVVYKSGLGPGLNLALFDLGAAALLGPSSLMKAASVVYAFDDADAL